MLAIELFLDSENVLKLHLIKSSEVLSSFFVTRKLSKAQTKLFFLMKSNF